MTIEWKTPPEAQRGRSSTKWSKIAAELRLRPNEWAKIGTLNFASQAFIIAKTHKIKVKTRKNDDLTFEIYGMYEAPDA